MQPTRRSEARCRLSAQPRSKRRSRSASACSAAAQRTAGKRASEASASARKCRTGAIIRALVVRAPPGRRQVVHDVAVEPDRRVAVIRRWALGDDREAGAAVERDARKARNGVDLERRADANDQIRASQSAVASAMACSGRSSPKRTTSGFTLPPHPRQIAISSSAKSASTSSIPTRSEHDVQLDVSIDPWTSITC